MTQFYVDDGLFNHHKARMAGLDAMGLWVMCGSYSGQQLTEGFVPSWIIQGFPDGLRLAEVLVQNSLWEPRLEHPIYGVGYLFHDWAKINKKTKESVQAERQAALERQCRHRGSDGVTDDVTNTVSHGTHTTPHHTTPHQNSSNEELETSPFEDFWIQYPKKRDKPAAIRAHKKALTKASASEILAGLELHKQEWTIRNEPQFIPNPATWLNGERWQDEPDMPAVKTQPKQPLEKMREVYELGQRMQSKSEGGGQRELH